MIDTGGVGLVLAIILCFLISYIKQKYVSKYEVHCLIISYKVQVVWL